MKRGRGESGGGHSPPYATVVADFAPPYAWISACAGMTGDVCCQSSCEALQW